MDLKKYSSEQNTDQISLIRSVVDKLERLKTEVEEIEEALKVKQGVLRKVEEVELPEAVFASGMSEFKLDDGRKIVIKEVFKASLKKDNQHDGFNWLRDNGVGDIIKNKVEANFGQGEEEAADFVFNSLMEQGLEVSKKATVHPQTLTATLKRMEEDGQEIPEVFSVYKGNKAQIK